MNNKEILIVEDNPTFRNSIKFVLKNNGYIFSEAGSVHEGVSQLNANPDTRVILLDLSLPDGTGGDFLEQIKERTSQYRIIILTGHEEKLAAEQAREYGVFNYLPKAATSFTQSIRFSVEQAFKDVERESLKVEREKWFQEKEQLIKKTEDLLQIQWKINSDHPLNEILALICESVLGLVGAYTCHIRLYNLKKGDFDLAAFAGPSDEIKKIFDNPKRKGDFFSGKVAESKSPRLFEDLQTDKDFNDFKQNLLKDHSLPLNAKNYLHTIRTAYIAPITTNMFDDETDAIFNISADSVGFFSEEKKEVIKEFVTQATIAITKAWQRKRKEETHQDYKGISAVLEDISKKLRGVDVKNEIYDVVVNGISEIIKPETISIFLHNKITNLLDNEAEFRGNSRVEPREEGHPTDEGLTGAVFTEGTPLRMPNLQARDRRSPQEHPNFNQNLETDYVEFIPSQRVEHFLCVPMIIGNEVIGAIQLLNKKSDYHGNSEDKGRWLLERGFSDDCENVLGIAASYLAVAIKNSELLEERSKKISQLETLKDVGRFTSTEMPLDELLNKIIEEAADDVQAEICMLFLLDENKNRVVMEQCYGISKEPLIGSYYEIGEGLTGGVALTGQSVLQEAEIPSGKYDEVLVRHLQQSYGDNKNIESLMVVPIKAKNEILGVIKAVNKKGEGAQYDKEDLSFFETFANYVGIAIENAQRYNLTNEELAAAGKNVALSHLVRAVVHEINNTKALIPINVQMIRERISRSDYNIKEMIDVIEDSAKQAVTFANSIQAFSASRLGKRKTQDINNIIKKAVQQLAPDLSIDRKYALVEMEEQLSAEPLQCSVYETPLIQVIQNIILNAYQAMERSKKKILTVTSYKDIEKNLAIIEFKDTGHGMSGEVVERIFDPEYTTKEGKGTGIGLWLANTHLSIVNAEIKVNSILSEGTTFTIEIPLNGTSVQEK